MGSSLLLDVTVYAPGTVVVVVVVVVAVVVMTRNDGALWYCAQELPE